ncbi:NADH-ubiquinone dehydrogenase [Ollibium composti]|uniref:NADH-ubiquinone dehydrogenase n=1 Tax=Ollibium composti TaxID=2675109 RepID=A0ABY2QCV4_9HYPH|nr:NADH-ubiquinone dehydrogenase [Mesorhizobium composti]THF59692.1 NADH-ubiquinone dehydrogenase [Mesorhizobium composti]
MSKPNRKEMPQEMASAVNLMAHPLAGAAALSAIGFGVASQALGMWVGAVAGATEASGRLLQAAFEDNAKAERSVAAAKVRARAKSVMEQAQTVAREVNQVATRTVVEQATVDSAAKPVAVAPKPVSVAAPQAVVPAKRKQPKAIAKPEIPDDLKAISGIGPKLEQVLNGLGIWTYRQVAAWSGQEIAWVDEHLGFNGRIGRDDWTGQAADLAGRATG